MCGICGKIFFDRSRAIDPDLIQRMTQTLRHRGPDDSGIYVAGHIGLGHRRLSIIDLSAAGRQPMANEDESLWLVVNGEIYNFEDLRQELIAKGHVFRSGTDSEVILHLYEEQGQACVERLCGMFAFALWDSRSHELLLARDRAGKKPLVYAVVDNALLFASELSALLEDPAISPTVNEEALHHYLTYQYVPGPLTIFQGIYKLPPAHTLMLRQGMLTIRRYWHLSYVPKQRLDGEHAYGEAFLDHFREAVRIRLRSDVPLGAFLSGGIDSSATVAVMSNLMNRPVKTFSIGFEETDYDERAYAQLIARQYNTDHTEFMVRPDALDVLPKLVRHYGEPFADPSSVPTYYVAQLTRRHVTVALNGDGGDESFAGYERYCASILADMCARLPRVVQESVIAKLVALLPYRDERWSMVRRLKRFLSGCSSNPAHTYVNWVCAFTTDMKMRLYTTEFMQQVGMIDSTKLIEELLQKAQADNLLERLLSVDVHFYLPYDLLVKADIACMAHGLEARSPFLDHRLMEFAAALPPEMKLRRFQTKYILKHALKGLVPRAILQRKKMGFGVPLHRWFRNELKEMAYSVLLDARACHRGYFNPSEVRRLLDEHSALQADHSYRLWTLLWLELWHRMFVDRGRAAGV
ncbi:MAG: asparagine synthase (glutamine-hydrolyzing) [Desulfobacterota bacterium]|nr:asparagine synthase (glutamine-hydrolyzing) [Thermodesulfobacteriota bacterium]